MPWWVQVIIFVVQQVVARSAKKKATARANQQQEQAALMAAQQGGILLNAETNDSPLPVIYGLRRVGGITCLKEVTQPGNGESLLHKVVAMGEGEVAGVVNYYFDSVLSTDARFAGVINALESQVGTDGQAASATMIAALAGKWTSDHAGKGVAYLYAQLRWSVAAWQGEPTITADVRGRLLYDPRDGGTRFSNNPALAIRDYLTNERYGRGIAAAAIDEDSFIAAANFCDERVSVPAHSEPCAVLAASDTLVFDAPTIFGLGDGVCFSGAAPGGLIGGSPTVTYYYIPVTATTGKLAATYANALAWMPSGSPDLALDITSGDGSPQFLLSHVDQARHQLDGVVDVEQTPLDNLSLLMTACRADLIYSAGTYRLKCDQVEASSGFLFDEDNITGGLRIQLASRRDRLNRVKGKFFNPAREWQPDFAVFDSTTYRTDDNELVLETELSLPYTANIIRAMRHAQFVARQSRLGIQVRFRASIDAMRCEIGDVVEVTHTTPGWTQKLFRVEALELRPDDEVDVVLSEYDAGAYDLDPLAEVRTAPVTNLPSPFGNLDIEDLTATSGTADLLLQGDGTVVPRVRLRWTPPGNAFLQYYEVQYALAGSPTEWRDVPDIVAPATEAFAYPVTDGDTFDLRMRAVTSNGNWGEWAYVYNHTVAGKSEPPTDPTGFTAQQSAPGQVVFSVDSIEDVDLKRVEVRLLDFGDTVWENGIPICNILKGFTQSSSAVIPGTWTFLARSFDTSENGSTNTARADLTVTADGYGAIASQEDAPRWKGTLSNFIVSVSDALVPESTLAASAHTNAELFEQYVPYPQAICTYTAPEIDKGIDGTARVYADIISTLGRGVTEGTAAPKLRIDTKLAAGAYDGFEEWQVGTVNFRYLKSQIYLDTTMAGRVRITGFETLIDALKRTEDGTYTTPAGGSVAVTFAAPFHSTPTIVVSPQGTGDVSASSASASGTGFTGYFKSAGAAAAGTATYKATGV